MTQTQAEQNAQLTTDVSALSTSFTGFEAAVATEIKTLKSSPVSADPAVATAIANIEALTAKIVGDTTAAAPAPASAPAPAPTPVPVGGTAGATLTSGTPTA